MSENLVLNLSRHDSNLYDDVLQFCKRYYQTSSSSGEKTFADIGEHVNFEPRASWIEGMLCNPKIHDADYSILKYLNNPCSIILDIGANWGYSAGAFFKLGIKANVISFEVLGLFEPVLGALKNIYPDNYYYYITGLGERDALLRFVVPVVNGIANSGLCSAHESPHLPSLAKNIVSDIRARPIYGDNLRLELVDFHAFVTTLDKIIPEKLPNQYRGMPVEAIKIDVEGLECSVLTGGLGVIRKDKPLVLAEGANRTEGIQALMEGVGYIYAERDGDFLRQFEGYGKDSNGFFLHKQRLAEYEGLGIYRP